MGVNRNTVNAWYIFFRLAIFWWRTRARGERVDGEVEVDESYHGAKRKRGFHGKRKRGRGTNKQPVFGLFERNLYRLLAEQTGEESAAVAAPPPIKTFKDYEPGFIHVDIKYLPQMPDEMRRRYLFVAIDRATRWVFLWVYRDQSETSSTDFLRRLKLAAPMKIVKVLTDNGSQFTDRFTHRTRQPIGQHAFDLCCPDLGIEHRLCPPRHPQTNGMVERFNSRVSEVVRQTRFQSAEEGETTLMRYMDIYNERIPQRALNHLTPVQALQEWQKKKPELFSNQAYNHTGPDRYPVLSIRMFYFWITARSTPE